MDGAVFSCNGIGNNHVDYAHAIEETEKRGVPTAVLSQCPAKDFVVQNNHLDGVVCYYKSPGSYGTAGGRDEGAGREHGDRDGRPPGACAPEAEDAQMGGSRKKVKSKIKYLLQFKVNYVILNMPGRHICRLAYISSALLNLCGGICLFGA